MGAAAVQLDLFTSRRRRVSEPSRIARERIEPEVVNDRERVYHAVVRAGAAGMTLLEFVAEENRRRRAEGDYRMANPNDFSGRFTELGDEERLTRLMAGDKRMMRDGAGVWVADVILRWKGQS